MSGLMDKVKDKVNESANNFGQPGDQVERNADNAANPKVNEIANDVGVPQQDDGIVDKIADNDINKKIPFGN